MAKKKRPAKKKKKTKKQQQQQEQLLAISIGFALILFAVFGFLKLGFLGILVANGFRIIAGNTYQLLCILLAILGFWVVVKNTEIPQKPRKFLGISVHSIHLVHSVNSMKLESFILTASIFRKKRSRFISLNVYYQKGQIVEPFSLITCWYQ